MKSVMVTTRMIVFIVTVLLSDLCMVQSMHAADYTLTSPDGNHAIGFTVSDGRLRYNVSYQGTPILSDSPLSLSLDGEAFSDHFQVDSTRAVSKNGSWVPVVGSKSSYPDTYNERVIHLSETIGGMRRLILSFRAYNEGVAFRYTIPEQEALSTFTITSENTEFQFTADHTVYWDDYPQAKYAKLKMSDMGSHSMRPLLVETGSQFVAIAEAGSLEHYAPMMLDRNGVNCLKTSFRRGTVSAKSPMSTPWRVVMVAASPGTLVENHYLLQNLSPPCAIGDTSWIKPGKVWRSKLTTAGAKAIIDYAAANNYQYVHYDAGWYGPERDASSNPVTVKSDIDMPDVIRYGRDRGIGLICYINKIAMSKYDLDHTLSTYEKWGISGVKYGFVDWQSQSEMEFLYSAIKKAAQYHLIVDIHDNFRLTGIERTYPNVLTVEGILGNEERATDDNPPENVLTTSFARMIAGAGDFTPCYLNGRVVSRAFQLALGVVFYSPLQYLHWYDQMDQYAGKSFPELEFWKKMPTTWDDSKVIHGSIGNYMTVARKKGKAWFVGTITNDGRTLDIPLSFLGDGTYTAKVYKEDPANKKHVTIETVDVTSSSNIAAKMGDGSGHAIWIYPTDKQRTVVSIEGERFLINGVPTYQGRKWNGYPIEGLLMNSRMVQGIFDDLNPETAGRWAYEDTKKWDPDRNTDEFVKAMDSWYAHGMLAFTINMQGGSPLGYGNKGWINSAYGPEGELRPAYMARLQRIMDKADEIGMVPILGLFYNDQEDLLEDETAVLRAVDNVIDWLFAHEYRHVIIEINNECNLKYRHEILQPKRVHEVIQRIQAKERNGHRFLVSTSYSGRQIPRENVVRVADFLLIHGNGVKDPALIPQMVTKTKAVKGYTPKPILFNEDDHFDFDKPVNHMVLAVQSYASWGLFDYRKRGEGYENGFQSVPVNWEISSPRKKAFFNTLAEITGRSSHSKPTEDIAFVERILPAPRGGGYEDPDYWVWGSSVIKGEDGKYHMFASRWLKKLGFGKWVTNSEVVHAVADTPVGPYKTVKVALPVRGKEHWDGLCTHNPKVVKYKDTYLLYYFGNTYDFRQPTVENTDLDSDDRTRAWMNKRVGVAISDSVYGPWKRLDKPVIEPREGHWDASITSNPAPVVNDKTGEILLMYKSSTYGKRPPLLLGVAKAKSPEGPYVRLSEEPIFRFETAENERIDVEDPYIWWNGEKYEAIIKDRSGEICGEEGGGVHAWSDDGVNWQLFNKVKAYSRDVLWDDGTTTHQNHFERPFLLIEEGVPTHLFAATGVGPRAWSFDKTWNMVIPLKTDWKR